MNDNINKVLASSCLGYSTEEEDDENSEDIVENTTAGMQSQEEYYNRKSRNNINANNNIILFSDNVTVDFIGNDTPEFKGVKQGRMYLTTHRMIFNSKSPAEPLRSFSFPFVALEDVAVEQPMFSANYIRGKIHAQPNGNFIGEVKFKVVFKSGGAIEFGQAMLKAAHLATRHSTPDAPPPPYSPPTGPWYAAPPPAYAPPPQGYYGWVPPYTAFPDQPPPNSVFVSNSPPPYPGVMGRPYPPGTGYSGVSSQESPSPTGAGFVQGPSAPPGYPGAPAGMSSNDAKAAEAAQSAYYDPNRPQTAYVPPPYNDQPPTYQESLSKKEN